MMPLSEFPAEDRERIEYLAAQDTPPPRWLTFHGDNGRPIASITSRAWFEWTVRHPRGAQVAPEVRRAVIHRDGLVCGLCGDPVESSDVHIDHIHPRSLGGSNDMENLQVAHALCNMRKGNRI